MPHDFIMDDLPSREEYDFDLSNAAEFAKKHKPKLAGIQLPEGLRKAQNEVAERVMRVMGCEAVVSADPSFGACDIADEEFARLGADVMLHFGHAKMPCLLDGAIPVIYVESRSNLPVENVVKLASKKFAKGERIGILTTVQHAHKVGEIERALSDSGLIPVVGKGDGRVAYGGQVLGCNFSSARVELGMGADAFLFVGSGNFHPLGAALSTKKKVIVADPYSNEVRNVDAVKVAIMRQRFAAISRARDAKSYAIIVGTKRGQARMSAALDAKRLVEKHALKAYLYAASRLEHESLDYYNEDAIVSTLCPRVAIDDAARFRKPVITPIELRIALGEQAWDEFSLDEILE